MKTAVKKAFALLLTLIMILPVMPARITVADFVDEQACPNCGQHMYFHEKELTAHFGSGPIYKNWYRCKFCGCIQSEYQLKNR